MTPHQLKDLLPGLKKLLPKLKLEADAWTPCDLSVSQTRLQQHAELLLAIRNFAGQGPCSGWLCFQSEVCIYQPELLGSKGIMRYGELQAGNRTLTIHEGDMANWYVCEYQEKPGQDYLREEVTQLGQSHGKSPGDLFYHRFWRHDPQQGFVQHAARFIGFHKGGLS